MNSYEVPEPILNSPFEEPQYHWRIVEGETPEKLPGRRKAVYYFRPPTANSDTAQASGGIEVEMPLVNLIRARLKEWLPLALAGGGGVTRTTQDLLRHWHNPDRKQRLFFAQLEAVETIIFLTEARPDFLQGVTVPLDEPGEDARSQGIRAFRRYACKMATGSGKTTVMGMLAAWSILNKVNDRGNSRYSDVALIICPNVTIRDRLAELDPLRGAASLYRTRDLVPAHLMDDLAKGRVLVTNWHVFEPQTPATGGTSARVNKAGVPIITREIITIGPKTTTARDQRYLTLEEFERRTAAGVLTVIEEERDAAGELRRALVETVRYVESDTALVQRVLGRQVGNKQNILVFNDEAHHAYRIRREADDQKTAEQDAAAAEAVGEADDWEEYIKEATVWVDGLDKVHKVAGINFCVDLSATPYFLGRVGQDTNRVFPWVVSEFGLTDAIESGLVKIPQLAVRDTTGAEIPGYFNVWRWILDKLTPAERGGKKASPKPEAILKWAFTPIVMLAGLWEQLRAEWADHKDDPRPPVFILVCKNTKIAKVIYEWLAEGKQPVGIPDAAIPGLRNRDGQVVTIRVDSKVVHETDTGDAKGDASRWMRLTLDTIGKFAWPADPQGRPIYPADFEELAAKLQRPLHPPGRDIRCIVSVGMLTEGWDCNTVTHIVGLRPFMSQLLCEQVVGRGLRRTVYEVGPDGKLTEEVAQIFGVPFEVIPFKANPIGATVQPQKRHHVHPLPERADLEIKYPRVQGYRQAIRNRITIDWETVPPLELNPLYIPPEVDMKASLPTNTGRPSLTGPGRLVSVDLNPYRAGHRFQELVFKLAADLTRNYATQPGCEAPPHVLFPQLAQVARRYLTDRVLVIKPMDRLDVFLSPYYGWVIERLTYAIHADAAQGEAPEVPLYETNRGPGSTAEVDFWTSRDVRPVIHSHLNYVVADTQRWEQAAAYAIDTHEDVVAFVKNAGLGFSIPYLHNGEPHDYIPDFIIRLRGAADHYLILETKGYDPEADIKTAAARRWTAAVNADGQYGHWGYDIARQPGEVRAKITRAANAALG